MTSPTFLILLLAAYALVACDGSTDDPTTASLEDLNRPSALTTLTQSAAIELWWRGQNVEEDFQGYYVFSSPKTISELQALVKYPATDVDITKAGVPRCKENSAFYEAFGLPKTDRDCEGSATSETESESESEDTNLQDDTESEESTETEEITGALACGDTATKPSVKTTEKTLGWVSCKVSKDKDGAALKNGTKYSFMVVAVLGSDLDEISWSSNIVEDAPSVDSSVPASVTLSDEQYIALTIDPTTGAITAGTAAACRDTDFVSACQRLIQNTISTSNNADNTLWLGRSLNATASSTSTGHRLYLSTSSNGNVRIRDRGSYFGDDLAIRRRGDSPIVSKDNYSEAGTKLPVWGKAAFDFILEKDSKLYYGKLLVKSRTLADSSATVDARKSDMTITIAAIFQTAPDVPYYLQ